MSDPQSPADKPATKDKAAEDISKPEAPAGDAGTSEPTSKSATKSAPKVSPKAKSAAKKTAAKPASKAASKSKAKDDAATKAAPDKQSDDAAAPTGKPTKKAATKAVSSEDKPASSSAAENNPDTDKDVASPTRSETGSRSRGLSGQTMTIGVAAVLGATLAMLVQFAFGLAPGDRTARTQLATLQSQVERTALVAGDPEAVGQLQVQLAGMEEDLRALNVGVARTADITPLEASLNDARERLAVLEAAGGRSSRSGRASNGDIAALESQIAALGTGTQAQITEMGDRVHAFEADLLARLDALVARQDFAALATRVVALEDDQLAQEMYKAATALGLAQLARTAQGSGPFAVELEALGALRPEDPYVAQLRPLAQDGVATEAMLASQFPAMARSVMTAHRASLDEGWLTQMWARITQFVSFRRTSDIEGDSVPAVLARAELRLGEANFSAAVAEMGNLPEAAQAPAEDWLTQAQGRAALNQLIAGLSTEVIGELEQ